MKTYHLYSNDKQQGAFTLEELKAHGIKTGDKVWYEGLETWIDAAEVPELRSSIKASPPPPPHADTPPRAAGPTLQAPLPAVPIPQRSTSNRFWLILVAVVVCIALFFLYRSQQERETRIEQSVTNSRIDFDRQNIRQKVKADIQDYHADKVLGGIRDLKVILFNNSDYYLDAVEVRVDYIRRSGAIFKSELVYFRNVAPKNAVNLRAPDSELGIRASCQIIQIKSAQLGL